MDQEDQEQSLAVYIRKVMNSLLYVFVVLKTLERKKKRGSGIPIPKSSQRGAIVSNLSGAPVR